MLADEVASVKAFQFHKGTIKTDLKPVYKVIPLKFQFHKGTIKTYATSQCL